MGNIRPCRDDERAAILAIVNAAAEAYRGVIPADRHAYVSPGSQGRGVGSALLERLVGSATRRMLAGTWAAAEWAIRFYRRHGFELVSPELKAELLETYWTIPDRQIETSVVLANPPLDEA